MNTSEEPRTVVRHRTALKRKDLSRPAKCVLRDGLMSAETSVFDYGCGHGGDVTMLGAQGITVAGWDPVFCPDQPVREADIVPTWLRHQCDRGSP
jgi:DNA phosphorothioation-associated putative methyltransferase